MNKLRPRNKICFQNNKNIHANLNINKLNKKKWILLKKNVFKQNRNFRQIQRKVNFQNKYKSFFSQKDSKKIILDEKYKRPEEKKKLYKERLFAKQQFKNFYGCIPEYQLKNLFNALKLKKDNTNIIHKFIILLESRLDMIVFRLQISRTIFEAKQIINHGKIKINNEVICSQNYILKPGDIISLNNFKISKSFYLNNKFNEKINKVNYLEFDDHLNIGIFLRKPLFNEIEYPFPLDLKLVDEYFKKN